MAKNKKKAIKPDKKIENLRKEMKKLVKERGMFENSKAGRKIDNILDDDFIKEMRGNGAPSILEKMRNNKEDHEDYNRIKKEIEGNGGVGLCEKYRAHRKMMWIQWYVIIFLVYLALGGSFRGITWDIIKENLGITVKTEQVEQVQLTIRAVDTDEKIEEKQVTIKNDELEENKGFNEQKLEINRYE